MFNRLPLGTFPTFITYAMCSTCALFFFWLLPFMRWLRSPTGRENGQSTESRIMENHCNQHQQLLACEDGRTILTKYQAIIEAMNASAAPATRQALAGPALAAAKK